MTLDNLITYLTQYRAEHPEHAHLEVHGETEGGCVWSSTDGPLIVGNARREDEPPVKPVLLFPEFW